MRLLHGLRDFIEANDRRKLEGFINVLKEELNIDSNGITQIHLALFLFRDAVGMYILLFIYDQLIKGLL